MPPVAVPSRTRPRTWDADRFPSSGGQASRRSLPDFDDFDNDESTDQAGSDGDLARRMFAEEAEEAERFHNDRALAITLHQAELGETELEGREAGNLQRPLRTMEYNNLQLRMAPPAPPRDHDQLPIRQRPNDAGVGRRSSWIASMISSVHVPRPDRTLRQVDQVGNDRSMPAGRNCAVCQEPITGVEIKAPCGHYYDKSCALELFEAAMRDESLFPPRCCRQIFTFKSVRRYMTADAVSRFMEKSNESRTLKRIYCANPSCSRFLGPEKKGLFSPPKYTCPDQTCRTVTCARCKTKIDSRLAPRHACEPDEQDRVLFDLARGAGWQRCPGCSRVVELEAGCHHMTCRCGTQFCYVCQAKWKKCDCPQWDEGRLVDPAEQELDEFAELQRRVVEVRRLVDPLDEELAETRRLAMQARQLEDLAKEELHQQLAEVQRQVVELRRVVDPAEEGLNEEFAEVQRRVEEVERRLVDIQRRLMEVRRRVAEARQRIDDAPTREPVSQVHPARRRRVLVVANQDEPERVSQIDSFESDGERLADAHLARPMQRARHPGVESSTTFPLRNPPREIRIFATGRDSVDLTSIVRRLMEADQGAQQPQARSTTDPRTNRTMKLKNTRYARTSDWVSSELQVATERHRASTGTMQRTSVKPIDGLGMTRHSCRHVHWEQNPGDGICENCHVLWPYYLFRCDRCKVLACKDCVRRRL